MNVYRVHFSNEESISDGFGYFSSRKEAVKAIKNSAHGAFLPYAVIKVPLTKSGVLRILNRCASHPDNG